MESLIGQGSIFQIVSENVYKELKEQFVSNLNGTTWYETLVTNFLQKKGKWRFLELTLGTKAVQNVEKKGLVENNSRAENI